MENNNILTLWMGACHYKINEGFEHGWHCYGPNAYGYSTQNGKIGYVPNEQLQDASIIFDTVTLEVYEMEVFDGARDCQYRWQNPLYSEAYKAETKKHDHYWPEIGSTVNLEDLDDFFTKMEAIMDGKEYDTEVVVPLDIPDSTFLTIAREAHLRNITFNSMVNLLLQEEIDRALQKEACLQSK